MDICLKIFKFMKIVGWEMCVVGVFKIIDNDLVGIDYLFGYGLVVKYVVIFIMELYLDVIVYNI